MRLRLRSWMEEFTGSARKAKSRWATVASGWGQSHCLGARRRWESGRADSAQKKCLTRPNQRVAPGPTSSCPSSRGRDQGGEV